MSPERGLWLADAAHRDDLATFVDRALRLDDSAVIRFRERAGTGQVVVSFTPVDPGRAMTDLPTLEEAPPSETP